VRKFHSAKHKTVLFIHKRCPARRGGLCVFTLTLEPLSYGTCNNFNADPGGFCRFFDRLLHRGLHGDAGVMALEAHQHVLDHCLCQSVALLLQTAVNSLLQLGYLRPTMSRSGSTMLASGAASLVRTRLKPKDAKAASA
jgi:hypothetical protein